MDQLAADVDAAWHNYDEEKLARMWEYRDYCLKAAIDFNGGNDYPKHRPKEYKEEQARLALPPKKRVRAV